MSQSKQTVEFEVLTDIGQTVQTSVEAVTRNHQKIQREVLTVIGRTPQVTSGRSDTEPTECTMGDIDRQWSDTTTRQWKQ